jgi:hypothetical protein
VPRDAGRPDYSGGDEGEVPVQRDVQNEAEGLARVAEADIARHSDDSIASFDSYCRLSAMVRPIGLAPPKGARRGFH